MDYKLTVITPCYNIAPYLPRFFESIINQTFSNFCLLVLDDGSSDNSLEICRKYAKKDSRITVIACEHMGVAKIRNFAISKVKTPLAAFADGDDYVSPKYLEHLVDAIEKYNADLAVSRVEYLRDGDMKSMLTQTPYGSDRYIERADFAKELPVLVRDRRLNYIYCKMFRSELLKPYNFQKEVRLGEDTILSFSYLSRAKSMVMIDALDYHYIKYTSRSATSDFDEDIFERFLYINGTIWKISEECGFLTSELINVICERLVISGNWVIEKALTLDAPKEKRIKMISSVLSNKDYARAYNIICESSGTALMRYPKPQDSVRFYKKRMKEKKKFDRRVEILKHTPHFVEDFYHKIKGGGAK